MVVPSHTDAQFAEVFRKHGPTETAKLLNLAIRTVYTRRQSIESRTGQTLVAPGPKAHRIAAGDRHVDRIPLNIPDGVVIVAGDAHYWPGPAPLMHRALVQFIHELRPKAVVMNGDVTDFASISRHAVVNWEKQPTVQDEIEICQDRLHEIAMAAGKVPKLWPLGNHDARFSVFLAQHAPEFAKVNGTKLSEHFPLWTPCWSAIINDSVMVKHFWKSGIHAAHNNVSLGGLSMVTNHLHSAKVTPYTDYTGTRYGVDTGCIADTTSPAFLYLQDNPRNWREAFAVLTFRDNEMLMPELVLRYGADAVQWRGSVVKVGK